MNQVPIKLGPLTLLLTVISICLTTLAILTFTTARADMSLAEKYARTVSDRYELEREGQQFLQELSAEGDAGQTGNNDLVTDQTGISWKTFEKEDARLLIGLSGKDGKYQVVTWKQYKEWEQDDDIGNLW